MKFIGSYEVSKTKDSALELTVVFLKDYKFVGDIHSDARMLNNFESVIKKFTERNLIGKDNVFKISASSDELKSYDGIQFNVIKVFKNKNALWKSEFKLDADCSLDGPYANLTETIFSPEKIKFQFNISNPKHVTTFTEEIIHVMKPYYESPVFIAEPESRAPGLK